MAKEDDEQSPWRRPGFIVAAVVVALVFLTGVGLTIFNLTGGVDRADGKETPSAGSTQQSSAPTSVPSGAASVCGLPGYESSGRVVQAPEATWEYDGTVAYPTSKAYGPAKTTDSVRSCFQHSPEGAVFAAANAVVQGTNQSTVGKWLEYFLADGPNREAVLNNPGESTTDSTGVRANIAGFRLQAYDGTNARVDMAVTVTRDGNVTTLSMVYPMVWQAGDWKLVVEDAAEPLDVAEIPDTAGYIPWGT